MKLVTAIIQPNKLEEVRQSLIDAGISRLTVSRCTGHGQENPGDGDLYRGQAVVPDLLAKVRLDIACNDEFVEVAVEAIVRAAKSGGGEVGDGKIFIAPLEECIRIRTGERGGIAI